MCRLIHSVARGSTLARVGVAGFIWVREGSHARAKRFAGYIPVRVGSLGGYFACVHSGALTCRRVHADSSLRRAVPMVLRVH